MARARNLKPSFFTDDEMAEIHPLGRLLFEALWCLADREGRLEDRPNRIKTESLPYDKCNVDKLLQDLHDHHGHFIIRYEVEGRRYIQIRQFLKHQDPHYKEKSSEIPAPPGWRDSGTTAGGVSGKNKHQPKTDGQATNAQRSADDASMIGVSTGRPVPPDSGFPLPDSLNRIPDSPHPPPDPGLPLPANAEQTERQTAALDPAPRPENRLKNFKNGTARPIGAIAGSTIGLEPGESPEGLNDEGQGYGMKPHRGETASEWWMRVRQERQKRTSGKAAH